MVTSGAIMKMALDMEMEQIEVLSSQSSLLVIILPCSLPSVSKK